MRIRQAKQSVYIVIREKYGQSDRIEPGTNMLTAIKGLLTVSQKLALKLFLMILERKHWIY
jgi:hypothetical protein